MSKFTEGSVRVETFASTQVMEALCDMEGYALYVGLDVHKDTIAVALAYPGHGEPVYRGEIAHTSKALKRLVAQLYELTGGAMVQVCYEAGACGYGVYRQLLGLGAECVVVAPSRIPRAPGERVKTDRRDAMKLARLLRAGELQGVWVPDEEYEAMRDLTRCRSDFKSQELKARQQLNGFVLRQGHRWPSNKTRWTQAHYNWLESLKLAHPWQQVVLQEYIEAVRAASGRVTQLTEQIMQALPQWSLAPVVDSLIALRGLDKVAAITVLAELGDLSRFDSPKQLMAYLGLVPGERSSGKRRRQGAITLTGNGHARRMLVESAWSYRFPARRTMHLKRKAKLASEEAQAIAWRAQKRLCGRYRQLSRAGKSTKVVTVAIARELAGFIWDIVRHEMPKLRTA